MPDPRGAGLEEAFQFSFARPSVRPSLRSNFGPYTFIKRQRDKGTTQELGNTGTKEHRNTETWEHGNLGTRKLGNTETDETQKLTKHKN